MILKGKSAKIFIKEAIINLLGVLIIVIISIIAVGVTMGWGILFLPTIIKQRKRIMEALFI